MHKVFIGTEDAQWLATEVLKHSVQRRSIASFEFIDLKDLDLGIESQMYTGFSFYRWAIPEQCKYKERAVYLDADIVVLCDLQELFKLDLGDKGALARPTGQNSWFTSVMLMDCAKLKHWKVEDWMALVDSGISSYQGFMCASPLGLNHVDFDDLDSHWNCLDTYDEETKILHYTNVPTQPWKKAGHPFAHVFLDELRSALDAGVVTEAQVREEIEKGFVYPEILDDVKKNSNS